MYRIDYVKIGERICRQRKKQKMTQSRLAELVNMSNEHISHIENGKTKLSLPALIEICNALDVSADFILMDNLIHSQELLTHELASLTKDCSGLELRLIVETAKTIQRTYRSR